jgi:non-ribosomal peptide synthetase component F
MFVMQTDWLQPIQIAGAESSALMAEGQDALFPLTIQIVDCGDDLPFVANIKHDDNLFSQDRAQRLPDHLLLMMETFASDPCIPVGEISLLTEAEKELVLHDWIGEPAPWPADGLAHEMFLRHAKETPYKVALHFGENSMTYAELDRMSNQLANCLQSKNIGPDVMVISVSLRAGLSLMRFRSQRYQRNQHACCAHGYCNITQCIG